MTANYIYKLSRNLKIFVEYIHIGKTSIGFLGLTFKRCKPHYAGYINAASVPKKEGFKLPKSNC